MEKCIILNGDYTYLNVVGWQRAMRLLFKGDTEVLKYSKKKIRTAGGEIFLIPAVMKLVKIIRMIYRNKVPYTKKNVLVRDDYTCMYCGIKGQPLEVEHIIPLSRGGKTSFDNCVASCNPCNNKKRNRTPSEAKMFLKRQPYTPTISEFIRLRMKQFKLDELLKDLGVY